MPAETETRSAGDESSTDKSIRPGCTTSGSAGKPDCFGMAAPGALPAYVQSLFLDEFCDLYYRNNKATSINPIARERAHAL